MTAHPQKSPKSGSVTLTISYGYDIHQITMSGRTYKRFQNGVTFEMKGQGFPTEEGVEQDYWTFNNSPDARIIVECDGGRDVYRGNEYSAEETQ